MIRKIIWNQCHIINFKFKESNDAFMATGDRNLIEVDGPIAIVGATCCGPICIMYATLVHLQSGNLKICPCT